MRPRRRLLAITLAATVLCLVPLAAAGCGGSGGAARTTPAPARSSAVGTVGAALIATADAICQRVNAQIAAGKPKLATPAEIARVTPRNVTLERRALSRLRRLSPPASLARAWQLLLSYRQALVGELRSLIGYARANNARAIASLASVKRSTHRALLTLAAGTGFRDCGTVG